MKQQRSSVAAQLSLIAAMLGISACDGGTQEDLRASQQNLTAECIAEDQILPEGAWLCPAPLSLECGAATPPLFVRASTSEGCGMDTFSAELPSVTELGSHPVRVEREDGQTVCETTLTIVDTTAPVVTGKTLSLWPPNHKLHTISVADCVGVTDACDPALTGEFIWASSDEPVNHKGDGNHAPDILIDDCGQVQVRAERQGPKDGRVYKLGVRVVDRAGHAVESQCTIVVDHDQRGALGADSGESYRITLDGKGGVPACDGSVPPSSPSSDAGTPDGGSTSTPPALSVTPTTPVTPSEPTTPVTPSEPSTPPLLVI